MTIESKGQRAQKERLSLVLSKNVGHDFVVEFDEVLGRGIMFK